MQTEAISKELDLIKQIIGNSPNGLRVSALEVVLRFHGQSIPRRTLQRRLDTHLPRGAFSSQVKAAPSFTSGCWAMTLLSFRLLQILPKSNRMSRYRQRHFKSEMQFAGH